MQDHISESHVGGTVYLGRFVLYINFPFSAHSNGSHANYTTRGEVLFYEGYEIWKLNILVGFYHRE